MRVAPVRTGHIKRGLPAAGILFYSLWKCVKVFLCFEKNKKLFHIPTAQQQQQFWSKKRIEKLVENETFLYI